MSNLWKTISQQVELLLNKGYLPVGHISHYADGSRWKKISNNGNKNDWVKLKETEKQVHEKKQENNVDEEDYRGQHKAPTNDGYCKPGYDLSEMYPDDIYSSMGAQYYGDGAKYDTESINVIRSMRNNPNARVKIYRAVPYSLSNQEKIEKYEKEKKYILKHGKLPPNVKNWDNISDYYDYIWDEIKRLEKLPESSSQQKKKINKGDWVTINLRYAKEHGEAHLNGKYKIISKIVKAKDIWTDANSIHEWGYDPQSTEKSLTSKINNIYKGHNV